MQTSRFVVAVLMAVFMLPGCGAESPLEPVCGDGTVDSGEQCDDGNTTSGDGCSETCVAEGGVCGDGTVDSGEQCDDGNSTSGDGCSETCITEGIVCGDGILYGEEQCDDGNVISGDGCSEDCTTEDGLPQCLGPYLDPFGAVTYAAGVNNVVAGSFDTDGYVDLAVADAAGTITILYGDGAGGFSSGPTTATGESTISPLGADLTGDGSTDLVVGSLNGVKVFIGNGDGTFAEPVLYDVGFVFALALGDVDGGAPDIVATQVGATSSVILHGQGDGTFVVGGTIPVGGHWVGLGDVDNDGDQDVIVAGSAAGGTLVAHNDGTGNFGTIVTISGFSAKAVADLDGNGKADLVGHLDGAFAVVLATDSGFASPQAYSGSDPSYGSMSAADLDRDGDVDVVATRQSAFTAPRTVVFANDGSGCMLEGLGFPMAPDGYSVHTTFAVDLTLDQYPDLIVLSSRSSLDLAMALTINNF